VKASVLLSARRLSQVSAATAATAALATGGFALTNVVFGKSSPRTASKTTVTLVTTTTATTTTALTTTAATTTTQPRRSSAAHSSGIWLTLAATLGASGVAGAAAAGLGALRRRTRKRVDERIDQIESQTLDLDAVAQSVRQGAGLKRDEEEFVKQRVRRRLVEAVSRDAVDLHLLEFLPRRPRSVKRALNDLALRTSLAVGAGLIGAESPVEARHLTKWVVLVHRWPALAESVEQTPDLLKRLEAAAAPSAAGELLATVAANASERSDLQAFLAAEPRLADVLDAVATLRPVAPPP
jgi:hypothetical protein